MKFFNSYYYFRHPDFLNQESRVNPFTSIVHLDLISYLNGDNDPNKFSYRLCKRMADSNINRLKYIPFRKKL